MSYSGADWQAALADLGSRDGAVVASASFNRQANTTAYASGQALAPSPAAVMELVVSQKVNGAGVIRRGRLTKSGTVTTLANFRAHLYRAVPTSLPADAAAFQTDKALDYLGWLDFDMTGAAARAFSDGVKGFAVPSVGTDIIFLPATATTKIYALLEARAAYVPASAETFTLSLEIDQRD